MEEFTYCIIQEEGPWFFAGLAIILSVSIILGTIFLWLGLLGLRRTDQMPVEIKRGDWHLKLPVPGSLALGLVLILAVPGVILASYDKYSKDYFVNIDFSDNASRTLYQLKEYYSNKTDTIINIADDIRNFEIRKSASGLCVADMIKDICDSYRDQLICEHSFFEREIFVSAPKK